MWERESEWEKEFRNSVKYAWGEKETKWDVILHTLSEAVNDDDDEQTIITHNFCTNDDNRLTNKMKCGCDCVTGIHNRFLGINWSLLAPPWWWRWSISIRKKIRSAVCGSCSLSLYFFPFVHFVFIFRTFVWYVCYEYGSSIGVITSFAADWEKWRACVCVCM